MPKYIDADRLIMFRVSNDPVVIAVNAAPAADVQEVVRCKDCKYALKNPEPDIIDYACAKHGISGFSSDDFCSYGTKMDKGR